MARPRKLPAGLWNRNGVYYSRFRANGRLVQKRLSSDFKAACELLNELKARADKADFGLLDNNCPWLDLKNEFLKWVRQSLRRPQEYESDLEQFEKFRPVQTIATIDAQYVVGYRNWRLSQRRMSRRKPTQGDAKQQKPTQGDDDHGRQITPRTVNREVATLRNMLNKGVAWKLIGSNPIASIKPLRHDKPSKQRRALTADEVQSLFDHSPGYLKPVWRMFMVTGLRRNELADLRFDDIDFDRRTVTVRAENAKSHKARVIPLDDETFATIERLRGEAKRRMPVEGLTPAITQQQAERFTREHVFVSQANTPLTNNLLARFYSACRKASIEGAEPGGSVDIHSLRVSFATLALDGGANPKDVQSIMGHSTLAMTMGVYAKSTERSKRNAISALPFANVSAPAGVVEFPGPAECALNTNGRSDRKSACVG